MSSTGPTTLTDPTLTVTDQDRVHAALAFITYTGDGLPQGDTKALKTRVVDSLKYNTLGKAYELVWGPQTFTFDDARYVDNMMFVVRHRDTGNMVVAIRGTNPTALLDWVIEDFWVDKTVHPKWIEQKNVRISKATDVGITALQGLRSNCESERIGGDTCSTVMEYLQNNTEKRHTVTVVGHSLAGALAPTFALWLHIKGNLDAEIKVVALAGATPGNQQFSNYYGARLGTATRRLHNPYDVVPLAWDQSTLATLPGLYEPHGIKQTWYESLALWIGTRLAGNRNYRQITPDEPSLPAIFQPKVPGHHPDDPETYLKQAGWQHHCGYVCALRLTGCDNYVSCSVPLKCDCPPQSPALPTASCRHEDTCH